MIDYLCFSWQGLVQMMVYLVGRGYYHHMVVRYPEKKRARWPQIDKKMIATYGCGKSKYQRARAKKLGKARLMFLRWESVAVVLATDGVLSTKASRAGFVDIRQRYARIPVSERVEFFIYVDHATKRATARLTKDAYLGLKGEIEETCRYSKAWEIRRIVERMNGLPCWHGVLQQKINLAKLAVEWAGKSGKRVRYSQFRLAMKRKVHKVFV